MLRFSLVFLWIFITFSADAAKLSYTVLSTESELPVEFANVGLVGTSINATTDRLGKFQIELPDSLSDAVLVIYMIGYETFRMKVNEFRRVYKDGSKIHLKNKDNILEEVSIKPKKLRRAVLGNTAHSKGFSMGFGKFTPGYELGVLMRIRKAPTYLDSVRISLAYSNYDSIFFRLNIYEYSDSTYINVLKKPLYVSMPTKQALNGIVLDLTKENVLLRHNFIVAIEMIEDLGGGAIFFSATVGRNNGRYRLISEERWKTTVISYGICAFVSY